jgi:glycosyltransferase involved in cell wall biosynthesis
MKILIVIPAYNEEKILEKNILRLRNFLVKNIKDKWEIVIAENGSTDKTLEIAKNLSQKYSDICYFHLTERGRGRALKKALSQSSAEILTYMDVDLSTDLKFFPQLIKFIKEGNDIVIGSRLIRGAEVKRSLLREILSRNYNLLIRFLFNTKIKDMQCGFKAINQKVKKNILPEVKDNEWFFDTELLILAERRGYKIKEIPVRWIEEKESKVLLLRTILSYLTSALTLKIRLSRRVI